MTDEYEAHFVRYSEGDADTSYHLIPNPDAESVTFTDGATLYWEDAHEAKPRGHFFIPAEDLRAIGLMFLKAAEIAEGAEK